MRAREGPVSGLLLTDSDHQAEKVATRKVGGLARTALDSVSLQPGNDPAGAGRKIISTQLPVRDQTPLPIERAR